MTGDQRVVPYFIARTGVAHGDVPTDVEPAFPPLSVLSYFPSARPPLVRSSCKSTAALISSQRGLLLHSQLPYTCRVIVQVHSHAIGRARIKKERSFPDLPLRQAESGCLPGQTSRPMPVKEEEKECVRSFAIPPIPALLHGLFGGVGYC